MVKQKEVGLGRLLEYAADVIHADEIIERNVMPVGKGAHVMIPLKHLSKKVKIIIFKNEEELE